MSLLSGLAPVIKPMVKELFDTVIAPELAKLAAQIPNADVAAAVAGVEASVVAYVDKVLA